MYKIKQEGRNFVIFNTTQSNVGEITKRICMFYSHTYDYEYVKKEVQEYCNFLNDREQKVLEYIHKGLEKCND